MSILRENIIVVDDFLQEPKAVRDCFVALPFGDVTSHDGETYKRVSIRPKDEFNHELVHLLAEVPVVQQCNVVRLNYAGENPNNAIHADSTYADFAAVLYLNLPDQCQGGTAFWRHKKTGWEWLPKEQEARAKGKSPARVLDRISQDWNDVSAWEQVALAEMRFNRIAIYPTRRFHSRYPFEAFGSTPESGRLVWCSFFST